MPVSPDGVVDVSDFEERLGDDVALVVVSAPSYPTATLDPVAEVAALTSARGIPLHVDACIGGLVLPFWPRLPDWDFAVPGVTSISADLHKYGYAPKGVSVLLQRGRAGWALVHSLAHVVGALAFTALGHHLARGWWGSSGA